MMVTATTSKAGKAVHPSLVPLFTGGRDRPLCLMAGPCVVEEEAVMMTVAEHLTNLCASLGITYVFKASLDKANRTSHTSFRGPRQEEGLRLLERVRTTFNVPVITDVHQVAGMDEVADVVDALQIPALLCRQTDLVQTAASFGKPLNIKKGQFMAPWDMDNVVAKARAAGNHAVMVCERGAAFGYQNLVVDMRSLVWMRGTGCPVIMDATHAVQLPGAHGKSSGGLRGMIPPLARAAAAVGVDGFFMETHPSPDQARSDGPNSLPLDQMESVLQALVAIRDAVGPVHVEERVGR